MTLSPLLDTVRSNVLRLSLSVAAAVAMSATATTALADAKAAPARADGQRAERVVATASAAKHRKSVRKARVQRRSVHAKATGRKVG